MREEVRRQPDRQARVQLQQGKQGGEPKSEATKRAEELAGEWHKPERPDEQVTVEIRIRLKHFVLGKDRHRVSGQPEQGEAEESTIDRPPTQDRSDKPDEHNKSTSDEPDESGLKRKNEDPLFSALPRVKNAPCLPTAVSKV